MLCFCRTYLMWTDGQPARSHTVASACHDGRDCIVFSRLLAPMRCVCVCPTNPTRSAQKTGLHSRFTIHTHKHKQQQQQQQPNSQTTQGTTQQNRAAQPTQHEHNITQRRGMEPHELGDEESAHAKMCRRQQSRTHYVITAVVWHLHLEETAHTQMKTQGKSV